ncbi:hypothetical protein ABPH35_05760 [Streptococcus sp. ZJ93]|uniref:hypothetical protein n=1 Tax=Streptococcus handemini TaxID=3161188 RepID=UPI0032EBFC86
MKKDLFAAKVVLNEEIQTMIGSAFGPMVEDMTKDEKIAFILDFQRALRLAEIIKGNPILKQRVCHIQKKIWDIAPEVS